MKKTAWKIIAIIGVAAIFGARMYFADEKRKNQEKQQQVIQELSRNQLEERMKRSNTSNAVDNLLKQDQQKTESLKVRLDSLGKSLQENQKKFEESMKKYESGKKAQ